MTKPASPLNTTIGSFKVPKGYKPYAPEQTFKSFGTLQSFTVTQLDTHKQGSRSRRDDIKLPNKSDGGTAFINNTKKSGEDNDSGKRNMPLDKSLPDIKDRNADRVRDNGTQTSSIRAKNLKKEPLKDFWVDTKSEWRAHNCKKQPESNGTVASFKGHSNSVVSEPISFKASTPKEPRFFDDPDSTSTGMSGAQYSSEFGPLNRKTKENKSSSITRLSDTLSHVTRSIYE